LQLAKDHSQVSVQGQMLFTQLDEGVRLEDDAESLGKYTEERMI